MDWFRVYHDIIDDPKILALPRAYRWHVIELLSVSSRQTHRGQLPSIKEIGIHLRLTTKKAGEIVETLKRAGFIDVNGDGVTLHMHGWEKRQFKSDNVSARTAGWRERSGERSQNVPVNGPDTETEQIQNRNPPTPHGGNGVVASLSLLDPKAQTEATALGQWAIDLSSDLSMGGAVTGWAKMSFSLPVIRRALEEAHASKNFGHKFVLGIIRRLDANGIPEVTKTGKPGESSGPRKKHWSEMSEAEMTPEQLEYAKELVEQQKRNANATRRAKRS